MGVEDKVISSISISLLDEPRISSDGSYLVPFNVSLDESILNDSEIIDYFAEEVISVFPKSSNTSPVIYVENEFTKKIYNRLLKNHSLINGQTWLNSNNVEEILPAHNFIFIEPCLDNYNIEKYWKENEHASFPTQKEGLIPLIKKGSDLWPNIVTLYCDSREVISNCSVYPMLTLEALRQTEGIPSHWDQNPRQWTSEYIEKNPEYIKKIIENPNLRTIKFIENYRKLLEEKSIIEREEHVFQ
jgi:hypothetical protein